jgi:hypothetical protein
VRVAFTEEDLDAAAAGHFLTKVVYLPKPDSPAAAAAAAGELISPRVDPDVDVIAEAQRQGHILAIVRLGDIDLQKQQEPGKGPPAPAGGNEITKVPKLPLSADKPETHMKPDALKVRAVLDEVDAKNRTISLTIPKKALKGKIIRVGNDAEIDVEGDGIATNKPTKFVNLPVAEDAIFMSGKKQIKFADLKAGMHLIVQLTSSERSQIVVRRVELSKDDGFQDIEIEKKDKR